MSGLHRDRSHWAGREAGPTSKAKTSRWRASGSCVALSKPQTQLKVPAESNPQLMLFSRGSWTKLTSLFNAMLSKQRSVRPQLEASNGVDSTTQLLGPSNTTSCELRKESRTGRQAFSMPVAIAAEERDCPPPLASQS